MKIIIGHTEDFSDFNDFMANIIKNMVEDTFSTKYEWEENEDEKCDVDEAIENLTKENWKLTKKITALEGKIESLKSEVKGLKEALKMHISTHVEKSAAEKKSKWFDKDVDNSNKV